MSKKKQLAIQNFIEACKLAEPNSSVYIGSDSQRFKTKEGFKARYATVLILHMGSKHGGKLFHWTDEQADYGGLKQRLLNEVGYAIDAFEHIVDTIIEYDLPVEIHLDLNQSPLHKSNIAVKEACGWVLGVTGVEAVLKPGAFAAAHAADHLVRNKPLH